MSKQKITLYAVVGLILLLFWSTYTAILLKTTDKTSRQMLNNNAASSNMQITKTMENKSKQLLLDINSYNINESDSINLYKKALNDLEEKNQGKTYYIANSNGLLFGKAGETELSIETAILKTALKNKFTIAYFIEQQTDNEKIALIVCLPQNKDLFLVEQMPVEDFSALVFSNLTFLPDYVGLFDEWSKLVTAESFSSKVNTKWVEKSIRQDSTQFIETNGKVNITKKPLSENYNIYIPLKQPAGWFIGGNISLYKLPSLYSSYYKIAIFAIIAWFILISTIIYIDITLDRKKLLSSQQASEIDKMTNLFTSDILEKKISAFEKQISLMGYSFVSVDIAAFSKYNSMFGETAGDELLKLVADLIRNEFTCGARIGGDMFAFLMKTRLNIGEYISDKFNNMIIINIGENYSQLINFKFGIFPIDHNSSTNYNKMYEGSQIALKQAKQSSNLSYTVFDFDMNKKSELEKKIIMNMSHALTNNEFLVYIQPKFNTKTKECCGGEVLVRWESPELGFLSPDTFIPLFERNGFIIEIDFYMLFNALKILQEWVDYDDKLFRLSVNLSRTTITYPNYLERLKEIIKQFSVPLEFIEIEITESAFEEGSSEIRDLIVEIKKLGFLVAMDDFGAGYSSLNSLRELPVDTLKIDREFLIESDTVLKSKKIIKSIINMAKEICIEVVCEGVETNDQLMFLKESGCDIVQGYYMAKPMPYFEFSKIFNTAGPVKM